MREIGVCVEEGGLLQDFLVDLLAPIRTDYDNDAKFRQLVDDAYPDPSKVKPKSKGGKKQKKKQHDAGDNNELANDVAAMKVDE